MIKNCQLGRYESWLTLISVCVCCNRSHSSLILFFSYSFSFFRLSKVDNNDSFCFRVACKVTSFSSKRRERTVSCSNVNYIPLQTQKQTNKQTNVRKKRKKERKREKIQQMVSVDQAAWMDLHSRSDMSSFVSKVLLLFFFYLCWNYIDMNININIRININIMSCQDSITYFLTICTISMYFLV